jgi:hypothetical protein
MAVRFWDLALVGENFEELVERELRERENYFLLVGSEWLSARIFSLSFFLATLFAPRSNPECAPWTLDCFGAKRRLAMTD